MAELITIDQITFTIFGHPATAGSKRAFIPTRKGGEMVTRPNGKPMVVITDDNAAGKAWRQDVRSAARDAYDGDLLRGPLAVTLRFYRPRPKSHFGSGKNSLVLKGSAPSHPTTKPDVLKLARAIEDALTGVVWEDDAQIVREVLEKTYGEPERVEVEISVRDPQAMAVKSF